MAARFWLYAHEFSESGAPLVLETIAAELQAAELDQQLRLLGWGGAHDRRHPSLCRRLRSSGLRVQVLDRHRRPPRPRRGDRLLLNSLALPPPVSAAALGWCLEGRLPRLDWFAHELHPGAWLDGALRPDLRTLLSSGELQLRVPSRHCLAGYRDWLGHDGAPGLAVQPHRLADPTLLQRPLPDFAELRLQLTGQVQQGNKGQMWLLDLVEAVLARPAAAVPRPLRLQCIGLEASPAARAVGERGRQLLGEAFHAEPLLPRAEAHRAMARSNVAVSCSREETFSLAALEAMALGQILLRNRTGGWHEQLLAGVNGFDLGDPGQPVTREQVDLLAALLDRQRWPDAALQGMAAAARRHAATFAAHRYGTWLLGARGAAPC